MNATKHECFRLVQCVSELHKELRKVWLQPCKICGKKHKWHIGKCPVCGVHEIPIPVSEKSCWTNEMCDGCEAYQDHLR